MDGRIRQPSGVAQRDSASIRRSRSCSRLTGRYRRRRPRSGWRCRYRRRACRRPHGQPHAHERPHHLGIRGSQSVAVALSTNEFRAAVALPLRRMPTITSCTTPAQQVHRHSLLRPGRCGWRGGGADHRLPGTLPLANRVCRRTEQEDRGARRLHAGWQRQRSDQRGFVRLSLWRFLHSAAGFPAQRQGTGPVADQRLSTARAGSSNPPPSARWRFTRCTRRSRCTRSKVACAAYSASCWRCTPRRSSDPTR